VFSWLEHTLKLITSDFVRIELKPLKPGIRSVLVLFGVVIFFSEGILWVNPIFPRSFMADSGIQRHGLLLRS
jgi:hypothetical protein